MRILGVMEINGETGAWRERFGVALNTGRRKQPGAVYCSVLQCTVVYCAVQIAAIMSRIFH